MYGPHDQTFQAFIGLGANLGQAKQTLIEAIEAIDALNSIRVVKQSNLYESAPVDAPGPIYTNAVIEITTLLNAHDVLSALQSIEHAFGRQRSYRHAPRTLDLDVLWFDHQTLDDDILTVPHPRAHQRAFVLMPWIEITEPRFTLEHQGVTQTLQAWLNLITDQPCRVLD